MFRHRVVLFVAFLSASFVCMTRPANAQTAIAYGENQLDSLSCGYFDRTPIASFRFTAEPEDRFVAIVTECSDSGGVCNETGCFCFDQCVELRDPNGTPVASSCSPRGNNNAAQRYRTRIDEPLSEGGTYTMTVTDGDRTGEGTYTLFVQCTNRPGRAEPMISGDSFLATQSMCGGVDTYTFEGLAGQIADLAMTLNTGAINPLLELYDPIGRAVALPGNGAIQVTLPRNGTYTALAYSAVHETGTYRISLALSTVFVRGDANDDGTLDIGDPVHILNLLFMENRQPGCRESLDSNNNSRIDITDGVFLLNFLFLGGPPPAAPTAACGTDPDLAGSPGDLGCDRFEHCP